MKDFRRTPKHMTRVPAPGPVKESVPIESGDEEDDVSFNRHVKVLQQECKKGRPNQQVLNELMTATFKRRHKEILDHVEHVSTLLQRYPALQSFDEVSCNVLTCVSQLYNVPYMPSQLLREFSRVINNPGIRKDAREQWGMWGPRVLVLAAKCSSTAVTKFLSQHTTDHGMYKFV